MIVKHNSFLKCDCFPACNVTQILHFDVYPFLYIILLLRKIVNYSKPPRSYESLSGALKIGAMFFGLLNMSFNFAKTGRAREMEKSTKNLKILALNYILITSKGMVHLLGYGGGVAKFELLINAKFL